MESIVALNGRDLDIGNFVKVARRKIPVAVDGAVKKQVSASREALDQMLERGEVVYGVNTGFGGNVKYLIPSVGVAEHQRRMLQHLYCGTGPMLSPDVVRGAMLLRVNALAKAFSAVRVVVLDRLVEVLNADIVPIVPTYGSVGASGDLIPSAYIASVLLGEGRVMYRGEEMGAAEALACAGIAAIELQPKEGLALVNGTTVMTSLAGLALFDTLYLARLCVAAVAMSVEALKATTAPFDQVIHCTKGHPGQVEVAAMLRRFTSGSSLTKNLEILRRDIREHYDQQTKIEEVDPIQTPYSLRCAPQGLGPAFETLRFATTVVEREMNSVNDNPLVDASLGRVYHTGNFYGGHVARVMDGVKIDLANVANWAHALMAMLVDPRFNNGLPANLVQAPGMNSGFKGMQLSQSSLVAACRHLAAPSSIHTLPTEQYNQDVVSLGLHSALTASTMSVLVRDALAILLLALCQSLDLRKNAESGVELGAVTAAIYRITREHVKFVNRDRPMHEDIERIGQCIELQGFQLASA
jgi:phenylalanine ammonia-lyase